MSIPTPQEIRAILDANDADATAEAALIGDRAPLDEAALRRALTEHWDTAMRVALSMMDAAGVRADADGDGQVTEAELDDYLEGLRYAVAIVYASPAIAAVAAMMRDTYREAAAAAAVEVADLTSARIPPPAPARRAQAAIARQQAFWVTAYGERHLEPRIKAVVDEVLASGMSRTEARDAMQALLGDTYQHGARYWDLVSGNAVTEARELARIGTYEEAGLDEVYLSTVRDKRRSEVCKLLKSRAYKMADLARYRDAKLSAFTTELSMGVSPMWNDSDVPLLRRMVRNAGGTIPGSVGAPGLHHGCRSRLVARKPAEPVTPI